MARYIDADKIDFSPLKDDFDRARTKVIIMGQPTADVVEVEKYIELRDDFIDFACSGTNNLAPYCTNRCVKCVDERGWCRYGEHCEGFNPDGERVNYESSKNERTIKE